MPGWHAKTRQLVADGRLIVLGIAPEQHGDRMALFLQWKGMEDLTVMLDSYNLLGLKAVPITLLIDESGVVRHRDPKSEQLEAFLGAPPAGVGTSPPAPRLKPIAGAEFALATAPQRLSTAVEKFRVLAGSNVFLDDPAFHFQRGVALRKLYDSEGAAADPEHFRSAIESWRQALAMDPSNYIWRRRLQQYGPRLDKPYPFYDWVGTARAELQARGIEPHPLGAELTGAEIASPLAGDDPGAQFPDPDPQGLLPRDESTIMTCNTAVVPHTQEPARAVRVFLTLTPNPVLKTKWNDEAGVSTIRLSPPGGWTSSEAVVTLVPPVAGADPALSPRTVEFELRRKEAPAIGEPATAIEFRIFYNACHGDDQICQFLRRDVTVDLALAPPAGPEPEEN